MWLFSFLLSMLSLFPGGVGGTSLSCGLFQMISTVNETAFLWKKQFSGFWDASMCSGVHPKSTLAVIPTQTVGLDLCQSLSPDYPWTGLHYDNQTKTWGWVNSVNTSAPWIDGVPSASFTESRTAYCAQLICSTSAGSVYMSHCESVQSFLCQILLSDCDLDCPNGSCKDIVSGPCQIPPAGWTSGNGSLCSPCPQGMFKNGSGPTETCLKCPSGSYSDQNGSIECNLCFGGFFNDLEGQSECKACAPGKYGNQIGSPIDSCVPCPPGRFSSGENSTFCDPCAPGTWSSETAASSVFVCKTCPAYDQVLCPIGSTFPIVGSGLYRSLDYPDVVYPCYPAEACKEAGLDNTTCSSGYVEPRCSVCATEHFRSGGKCIICLIPAARWSIIVISGILVFVAIAKLVQSNRAIPPTIRLTLFWCQFLGIYPSLSSSWPPFLFNYLNFSSVFNLDVGYLGIQCDTGPNSYLSILVVKILLPVIFCFYLVGQNVFAQIRKRVPSIPVLRIVSQTIFVTNFLSLQLLSSMFQVFNCVDGGNGSYVVRQEPSVLCGSKPWKNFVIFDSIMIFLYLVLTPVWIFRQFVKSKKTNDRELLKVLIEPMCQSCRSGAEFFEFYRLGFRLGFILIKDTLPLSTDSKIMFLTLLLLSQIWLESDIRPYMDQSHQGLALLWEIVCVLLLVSSTIFTHAGFTPNEKTSFGISLVSLCILVTFTCVLRAIQSVLKEQRSKQIQLTGTAEHTVEVT
eukprot:TRINITY_DN5910_c0_g2_i4.p1 TRINITY_DN5910_c0_g2~~TRINITY_DN5910_c0_g2_i4.p1  ORF type:complete len:738 (+),score=86.74 TRINITY_DN5910_c0_g2_i4:52-2265(+)